MTISDKLFRDYATRVSFNLSLSRNQLHVLHCVVLDIELASAPYDQRSRAKQMLHEDRRLLGLHEGSIVGQRSLVAMGLIEQTPEWEAEDKRLNEVDKSGGRALREYWGPVHRLTLAGEHVVALLRIAGLIHPAVANSNTGDSARKARKKRS
jgi:hypothetical protein